MRTHVVNKMTAHTNDNGDWVFTPAIEDLHDLRGNGPCAVRINPLSVVEIRKQYPTAHFVTVRIDFAFE